MDPISAIANIYAVYQLVSVVGAACFRYAQGVRRADSEVHSTIDEIQKFQNSLRDLSAMLQDERQYSSGKGTEDRLQSLRYIMAEDSILLKNCKEDFEKLHTKLMEHEKKAGFRGQAKALVNKLKWPLKHEDVERVLDGMRSVADQIRGAQQIDVTAMTRTIDTTTKENYVVTKENNIILKAVDSASRETGETITELKKGEASCANSHVDACSKTDNNPLAEKDRKEREDQEKVDRMKNDFVSWLRHVDYDENHNIACNARNTEANTGTWFTGGSRYTEFKNSENCLLWLHGDPGSGKTVLAATAIEDLKAMSVESKFAIAYWYFNGNDTSKRNLDDCARALLVQLLYAFNKPPSAIEDLWNEKSNGKEKPKTSDLTATLSRLVSREEMTFYIVLDALDESDEDDFEKLLKLLEALLSTDNRHVRIMVTSRTPMKETFYEQIREQASFYDMSFIDIAIEREAVDADIRAHVEHKLATDAKLSKWPVDIRDTILKTLLDGAEGMQVSASENMLKVTNYLRRFRWVDCQLDALRRCKTPMAVKNTLKRLPKNLEEQYRRDLVNISGNDAPTVFTILKWLAFPQRKLRLEEAAEMVAVVFDEGDAYFEPDLKQFDSKVILTMCGSLTRIDENKAGVNHLGESVQDVTYLTTSHKTVLDFLASEELRVGPLEPARLTRVDSRYQMALSCLTYLHWLFEDVPDLNEDNLGNYPCARLSAEYFDDFIRDVIADKASIDMSRLNELTIQLMDSPEMMLKWVQLCDPNNDWRRVNFQLTPKDIETPLYYAALLGLDDVLRHYIEQGNDVNCTSDIGYGTPLVAAAAQGRKMCAQILLEAGAEPNKWARREWGRPLAVAIENDNIEVVKLLLEHDGVDVSCLRHDYEPDHLSRAATNEASEKSKDDSSKTDKIIDDVNEQLEKISIDAANNADDVPNEPSDAIFEGPDNIDEWKESLVYIAVQYNSPRSLDMLLERKADVNIVGGKNRTALLSACSKGRADLALKLLDHGAGPTIYGSNWDNALIAACEGRVDSIELLSRLIKGGIDVNRRAHQLENLTALYSAVDVLELDAVKLLLDNGADVNTRGASLYDNALQVACARGHESIARLLLERGADTSFQGAGKHDNCLMAAAWCGHSKIVKMLLEAGVPADITGGVHKTPLISACQRGNEKGDYDEITRFLLEAGADPNTTISEDGEFKGFCPMICAKTLTQLKLLVEHGAEVNPAEEGDYAIPFLQAILDNEPEHVKFLLEHGGQIQRQSKFGLPLSYATFHGRNMEVYNILLETADVNAADEVYDGGYPILIAAAQGRFDCLDALVKAGANPNLAHWTIGSLISAAALCGDSEAMIDKAYPLVEEKNGVNKPGLNALLMALKVEKYDSVRKLLKLGYKWSFTDKRGCNALHFLSGRGAKTSHDTDLLEMAIESGVDVNAVDNNGWTALHWAAASSYRTWDFIDKLLKAGADKELKDNQGLTPLELAYGFQNPLAFEMLRGKAPDPALLFGGGEPSIRDRWYPWNDYTCATCGDARGNVYKCTVCTDSEEYWFCFRCGMEKEKLHHDDHELAFEEIDNLIPMPETLEYPEPDGTGPTKFICDLSAANDSNYLDYEEGVYEVGVRNNELNSGCISIRGDSAFSARTPYYEITVSPREGGVQQRCALTIGLATIEASKPLKSIDPDIPDPPPIPVGRRSGSWGYDATGHLFYEHRDPTSTDGVPYAAPILTGDTVGCGIDKFVNEFDKDVTALFWTLNGHHQGAILILPVEGGRLVPVISKTDESLRFTVNWGNSGGKDGGDGFVWEGTKWDGYNGSYYISRPGPPEAPGSVSDGESVPPEDVPAVVD